MNVLDPFEVAEIEVFPFHDLEAPAGEETTSEFQVRVRETLASAEYTVYCQVLEASKQRAVLNEADIPVTIKIELPKSFRRRIVPDEVFEVRNHPDVRIARRANTIASLAKVISEREVSGGLRRTLLTQARRLELLAKTRLLDFAQDIPQENFSEETGTTPKK